VTPDLRGRAVGREQLLTDAIQAVQYLEAKGHEQPVLMAYSPVARVNPYTALLYSRLWDHGIAPVPVMRFADLAALLPLLSSGTRIMLHLQWTSDVLRDAGTEAEAKDKAGAFVGLLDAFLEAGGRLAWTVHNGLPHDCRFPRIEAGIEQAVADRARLVHVLNHSTVDAVAEWFTIEPAKAVTIPHPHYLGSYQDFVPRDQARYDLGLLPDEIVYAFVGAIKPYKGLDLLLDAFDAVRGNGAPARRLLVAGNAAGDPQTQAVLDRCLLHPQVVLRQRLVPDGEMQYYLRAADIAVLPYRRSLNSGVLLLALSFGLPVVALDSPATAEITTADVARTFRPDDPGALTRALAAADELVTPAAREAALRIARRYDPHEIAEQFAALAGRLAADWPLGRAPH
jgi:glycosyltransferase involved in cell wall biosynthesis